ncbi:hypothetical protein MHL39_10785 [Roseomonas mucosa]|uniref:hypothetical protein n=1 Tax=Roseomonas mucosa TaxID=207340 RepID=UPI001EF64BE9|nr:hypothetical protein [Roseomonas mucosa]MCG7357124.1 hypothetical protein [Roseomonas mucosa]
MTLLRAYAAQLGGGALILGSPRLPWGEDVSLLPLLLLAGVVLVLAAPALALGRRRR